MTPDVQLVKGQNRQKLHKNAIFCVQVVNSNYHKNRTRRRKNIPRTFLESLGPILFIRRKMFIWCNLSGIPFGLQKGMKTQNFFNECKVWVLSFPKTSLECFCDVWFDFYDSLNSPLKRKKSHFCAIFDDFGP